MITRTRMFRVAVVTLAVVALAGCNAIPGSGQVQVGLTDLKQVDQLVQFNPSGPVSGSSQEDLVRGFVQAATSSSDDYSVAREFLSTEYADQWDPYTGVLIDDGSRPYRDDGGSAGVLSLAAAANVDTQGVMVPAEPGPTTDMRFEFERAGDEWRISSAPSGIILDRSDFLAIWSSHELNFIGPDGLLVPETRWYLNRAALSTEIVGGLIEGPGRRMQESVRSGFPAGTTLVTGSVPIVDGHAKIDLSGELLEAEPGTLEEVVQQLSTSLKSVQGVNGFELLVDGASMREGATATRSELRPSADVLNPAVIIDGTLGILIGGDFREIAGLTGPVIDLDPNAVTLSADATSAAVQHPGGVSRVKADESVIVDAREGLLEPSFDAFGVIWTVQSETAGQLRINTAAGVEATVAAPWLAGRDPVAVRLSPDGSQIAALVESTDGSVVLVAGVVRDDTGVPLRTTDEAVAQLWTTGAPVDFDWIDDTKFAALTNLGSASKITTGGPGLFSQEQGSVPNGTQISGGGSRSQLRVLGDGDDLFASQGSGWQRIDNEIELLAKRG